MIYELLTSPRDEPSESLTLHVLALWASDLGFALLKQRLSEGLFQGLIRGKDRCILQAQMRVPT